MHVRPLIQPMAHAINLLVLYHTLVCFTSITFDEIYSMICVKLNKLHNRRRRISHFFHFNVQYGYRQGRI